MEFYFQIKDSLNGFYFDGRSAVSQNWSKESGKKRYHSVDMAHQDAASILRSKMGGRNSVVIVKRYSVNGRWIETPVKVVNKSSVMNKEIIQNFM